MSLSIVPFLIVFASQSAAHPHHHQRQVRTPHHTEGAQPATKPAPKPTPKEKHVQLLKMKHKVGKGFYSTLVDEQKLRKDHAEFCLHMAIFVPYL